MKTIAAAFFILALGIGAFGLAKDTPGNTQIPNRLIDYDEFRRLVINIKSEREPRRLDEDQFLAAMLEKGVVILDARSRDRYDLLHVMGAVSLPFTDFTEETLAHVIPSKNTKVLIYCNNNFLGNQQAFASKSPAASLNLSTYTSMKAYGYENIYELGPLLNLRTTKLPFSGELVRKLLGEEK